MESAKRAFKLSLLSVSAVPVLVFLAFFPAVSQAQTHEPVRIDFTVLCDDQAVQDRLFGLVEAELKKDAEIVRDEQMPQRKLFLYAQKDTNDRKNPEGWSFAIAHVSNVGNRILGARLEECQEARCADAKKLASLMVKEEGFLKYLNVAHVDELSDPVLEQLISTIFKTFAQKVKGR